MLQKEENSDTGAHAWPMLLMAMGFYPQSHFLMPTTDLIWNHFVTCHAGQTEKTFKMGVRASWWASNLKNVASNPIHGPRSPKLWRVSFPGHIGHYNTDLTRAVVVGHITRIGKTSEFLPSVCDHVERCSEYKGL